MQQTYAVIHSLLLLLLLFSLKQLFHATKHDPKRPKYKETLSIDHIGNGDPMHEASIPNRISRAWEQQEEEADTKIIVRVKERSKKSGKKERGHKGEKSQTRPK